MRFRGFNRPNARKETIDGYTFDSQMEAKRYRDLKLMAQAGEIQALTVHPTYGLYGYNPDTGLSTLVCLYVADFDYYRRTKTGELSDHVTEDVKGVQKGAPWTLFRLKAKLFAALCGREIEVYPPKVKKPRRRK